MFYKRKNGIYIMLTEQLKTEHTVTSKTRKVICKTQKQNSQQLTYVCRNSCCTICPGKDTIYVV